MRAGVPSAAPAVLRTPAAAAPAAPAGAPARNVILFGNADTNAAWDSLLKDSPIRINRSGVRIGDKNVPGENLACLFVRPMPGDARASVAVVAGTGLPGARLADRLPIFVSGVGVPDWVVLSTDMLTDTAKGVVGAGFFGNDWSLSTGDAAWLNP